MQLTGSQSHIADEVIHGVTVSDPYRWLEDRTLPETEEWIRTQQADCAAYFGNREEFDLIRKRVRAYLDIETVDQAMRVGKWCFYRRRNRGCEQACIYVRDNDSGVERLLVDPSIKSSFTSVEIYRISRGGALLAYVEANGGSDRRSVYIVDVALGAPLRGHIETGYPRGLVFNGDGASYFYSQEDVLPKTAHTIKLRQVADNSEDVVFSLLASRNSRLRVIGDENTVGAVFVHEDRDGRLVEDLWVAEKADGRRWLSVFTNRALPFRLALRGGRLFAISYDDAINGKLIELDRNGNETRSIIPHSDALLRQVAFVGDWVCDCSTVGETFSIRCWDLEGAEVKGPTVPAETTAALLPALGPNDSIFLTYEGFDRPISPFEYVPGVPVLRPWSAEQTVSQSDPVRISQTKYRSSDGTSIPITLVARQFSAGSQTAPVIMTSYGSFGVPSTPQFSVLLSILVDCGFIFAIPHIRGGGEHGGEWHEAGIRERKWTSFNDFIAAAEWLRDEQIADAGRLAILGGSHSGLLVAVAMTQSPDLFRAVLCIAPLLDMVRYEVFDRARKWKDEYGSRDSSEQFRVLHSYSPYHQVRTTSSYPATMFVTGDQDDRCNPAHVRKMAARMLANPAQRRPVLVDYSENRGHSPTLPLSERVEALMRRISFLLRETGVSFREGGTI